MFADELERIDRGLQSKPTLSRHRMRAYYEFRDPSEPGERLHPVAPRRIWPHTEWPTVSEECSLCGRRFWTKPEYFRHIRAHGKPRATSIIAKPMAPILRMQSPGGPADVAVWTCLFCGNLRYKFADSTPPQTCKHCGSDEFELGAHTGHAA